MPTILLRRGTTAEREAYTPLQGEIIFDTDENKVYTGDGTTAGGIHILSNALTNTSANVLEFKVNSDTISSTATHTITNSYTEITTSNETSDLGTNDAPAITLTGNNGSIVYVYFKTAGTRTAESSPFGTTTRNITVQGVSMVQGNFKTFFKTTDGWKEI
jgi:hypothetical protein